MLSVMNSTAEISNACAPFSTLNSLYGSFGAGVLKMTPAAYFIRSLDCFFLQEF